LRGGQMLILAPGTEHAVAAEEEGEILVTVHLTTMVDEDVPPST
jgi:quercetin dioxygenase-like cupin family protein